MSREQVDTLETSPAYEPFIAAVQDAESDGLDVDWTLPRLTGGCPLTGADDLAAVLHRRVTRWANASRSPR